MLHVLRDLLYLYNNAGVPLYLAAHLRSVQYNILLELLRQPLNRVFGHLATRKEKERCTKRPTNNSPRSFLVIVASTGG